jgi:lia operon protein LiaF
MLVGSSRLDFTDANFPNGESTIRIIGFVADVKVILPEEVGLVIESSAIVSELKGFANKEERIFNTLDYATPEYHSGSKKVRLQTIAFVSEIRLKRPLI